GSRMFRSYSLLQKVAIVTIVPIVALGLLLQRAIERQVQERALSETVRSARLTATLGIQPQLATFDLQTGLNDRQVAQLDRALSAPSLDGQIARIKIWDATGRIAYSDDHSLIGAGSSGGEPNEGVAAALEGETEPELLRRDAPPDEDMDAGTAELLRDRG